jgi:hypothetical protein
LFLKKTLRLKVKSREIAFSLALGVFIGLSVPIGLQTIVAAPIALLFQCNLPVTLTATLISNPVTVVPLYYLYFQIGEFLSSINIPGELITNVIQSPTFDNISKLSVDAVLLFFIGSVLIGITGGLFTYFASFRLINWYRTKRGISIDGV